jgi:hypothetical protein
MEKSWHFVILARGTSHPILYLFFVQPAVSTTVSFHFVRARTTFCQSCSPQPTYMTKHSYLLMPSPPTLPSQHKDAPSSNLLH